MPCRETWLQSLEHLSLIRESLVQRRIVCRYQVSRLRERVRRQIQRELWRWTRLYLDRCFADSPRAPVKLLYNNGLPITLADVHTLVQASDGLRYLFHIPVERCVWGYGWRYTPHENPLCRYYDDPEFLRKFYANYRPVTLGEALTLDIPSPLIRHSQQLDDVLTKRIQSIPRRGAHGLPTCHGNNQSGPVSWELCYLEESRLRYVYSSILKKGWCPDRYEGHLRGFFIIQGDDYVFRMHSGCHRAAALVSLGHSTLPATFQLTEPRVVIARNPVQSQLFEFYFDPSLRQKRLAFLNAL